MVRLSPRWTLATLSLSTLLPSLGSSIANVGLPAFSTAFGAPFQAVQWVVLAYLLALTALIISAGRLGDGVGRRRLLLTGILLFTLASGLCGLAPTLPLLIAARGAQGLGAAIMLALSAALVAEVVPAGKTGSAMGFLGAASAVGTALGPALGGAIIAAVGWRGIFLVNVPLGTGAWLLAYRSLPCDRAGSTSSLATFDVAGTASLAFALGAYALAMTIGRGRFGWVNLTLALAAVLSVVVFIFVERAAVSPLLPFTLLRDPALTTSLAASALVSTVVMATLVVGPFYLSRTLGLGSARAGLVLSVGPVVAALTGVPAGRLTDRIGAARVAIVGLITLASGAALLSVLPANLGVPAFTAAIAIMTAGYALFQTANNTAVMTGMTANQRGVAGAMLSLSRNLGLITGASAMGALFAATSMRVTFAIAAALVITALAIVTLRWHSASGTCGPVRVGLQSH